jgi:tetratricopeptide (TPR) repeat protein
MPSCRSNPGQPSDFDAQDRGLNEPLLLASVLFFAAAAYIATLRFDFVYDDQTLIVGNTLVRSWRYVPDYFLGRTSHGGFQNVAANYYRPLIFVWLRVNYSLFGPHPFGWHAATVLMHLLATLLAYLIARHLTRSPLVASLAALIFGVHPMTHEVVAWVTGATESLCAVFAFGAFLSYLHFRETRRVRWLLASCGLYAAGVLSKEVAITVPALVFAHWWIYGSPLAEGAPEPFWRRLFGAVKMAGCYLPIAAAYLEARVLVLHGFSHPQVHVSPAAFLLTLPSLAFFYYKQWLLPIHPTEFYETPISTTLNVTHVLLPFGGLVLIAVVLWLIRRKLGTREVAFASAWMVLPILPPLYFVVFALGDVVHDRYFYLPSFGPALLLALALEKLAGGPVIFGLPRRLSFVMLALVLILCWATSNAASYWRDNFTLFEHAYKLAPHSVIPRINYAVELTSRGELGNAIPLFEQVLKEHPDNYLATYGLGCALYKAGILKAAEHFFEQTEQLNPDMAGTYLHLGLIEMKTQRTDQAVGNMRRALAIDPVEPAFHFALGMALQQQGNCKESRSELAAALNLDPSLPHAAEQIEKCGQSSSSTVQAPAATLAATPAQPRVSASEPER